MYKMPTHNKATAKNKRTKPCINCGQTFRDSKMFWKRKFCSPNCKSKFFYQQLKKS